MLLCERTHTHTYEDTCTHTDRKTTQETRNAPEEENCLAGGQDERETTLSLHSLSPLNCLACICIPHPKN